MDYYPLGTLEQHLADVAGGAAPPTSLRQLLCFAQQITSVLLHINRHPWGFYPDLKPDNILLRKRNSSNSTPDANSGDSALLLDAVLIDLEQRGGWYAWSPPEIAYLEYLEVTGRPSPHLTSSWTASPSPTNTSRRQQQDDHQQQQQRRPPTGDVQPAYEPTEGGFSGPWQALAHQGSSGAALAERAQVFMLGKLLWCLFEQQPTVRCGLGHELLRDEATGPAFPAFARAPSEIRELIRSCTRGAPEWAGRRRWVAVQDGKLVPAATDVEGASAACWAAVPAADAAASPSEQVRNLARRWWEVEMRQAQERNAEACEVMSGKPGARSSLLEDVKKRPLLKEVMAELKRLEDMWLPPSS